MVIDVTNDHRFPAFLQYLEHQDFFQPTKTTRAHVEAVIEDIHIRALTVQPSMQVSAALRDRWRDQQDQPCAELMRTFIAGINAAAPKHREALLGHELI